ncbi:hypothetical protein ACEPPN_014867 [Leptodophora sp. 'Broadleaf-Isolate-01']
MQEIIEYDPLKRRVRDPGLEVIRRSKIHVQEQNKSLQTIDQYPSLEAIIFSLAVDVRLCRLAARRLVTTREFWNRRWLPSVALVISINLCLWD